MPLVIVGGRAWKSENELRLLQVGLDARRDALLRERVRQFEYVPAKWLSGLVRGARAVVFPSLSEGFGLPVLEAMQVGVPVLTSREGSLAEIGGDAVLLADAYDTASIGAAMHRISTDETLHAKLAKAGPIQAEHFSPAAYHQRLIGLYTAATNAESGSRTRDDWQTLCFYGISRLWTCSITSFDRTSRGRAIPMRR